MNVLPQMRFTPTQKMSMDPTSERLSSAPAVMMGWIKRASRVIVPWNTPTGKAEKMAPRPMKRFVKCFFELLTQIIVKVRKCKVQRVCVLHFQLAGSGGCFFLMKLYH